MQATNKLSGEGWGFLLPLRRMSQLDLRHQLGNRRLALPAGLLALPALQARGRGAAGRGGRAGGGRAWTGPASWPFVVQK